jgi:hypothetical protein
MWFIDMMGRRIGRLTVIESAGTRGECAMWRCRCDCGKETIVAGTNLRKGNTQSCGCLLIEWRASGLARVKHEAANNGAWWPEYRAWVNARFGTRRGPVCERWRIGENGDDGFECFIADMGRKPQPHFQLRRINPAGEYAPDNCLWAPQGKLSPHVRQQQETTYGP